MLSYNKVFILGCTTPLIHFKSQWYPGSRREGEGLKRWSRAGLHYHNTSLQITVDCLDGQPELSESDEQGRTANGGPTVTYPWHRPLDGWNGLKGVRSPYWSAFVKHWTFQDDALWLKTFPQVVGVRCENVNENCDLNPSWFVIRCIRLATCCLRAICFHQIPIFVHDLGRQHS